VTRDARPAAAPSAEALLEAMSEAMYVVDRSRTITYWNAAAELITGYPAADVLGRQCRDGILNHVDDCGQGLCRTGCPLLGTMRDGRSRDVHAFLHHRDGHRVPVAVRSAPLRDPDGRITGAVEVFHDNSQFRALSDHLEDVEQQALTDPLTGIPNRRMLGHILERHHDEQQRYGRGYAVLFADVDHFKLVNDTYDHDVGDDVLKLVASTLTACTRTADTVGRWGGEEFLLIAPGADTDRAVAFAERARQLVASTWTTHNRKRVRVTLSLGVAVAQPGEASRHLVNRADAAMMTAKATGRNRTVIG